MGLIFKVTVQTGLGKTAGIQVHPLSSSFCPGLKIHMTVIINIKPVNHLYNALIIYIEIVPAIVERASGKGLESAVYPRRLYSLAHGLIWSKESKISAVRSAE